MADTTETTSGPYTQIDRRHDFVIFSTCRMAIQTATQMQATCLALTRRQCKVWSLMWRSSVRFAIG